MVREWSERGGSNGLKVWKWGQGSHGVISEYENERGIVSKGTWK